MAPYRAHASMGIATDAWAFVNAVKGFVLVLMSASKIGRAARVVAPVGARRAGSVSIRVILREKSLATKISQEINTQTVASIVLDFLRVGLVLNARPAVSIAHNTHERKYVIGAASVVARCAPPQNSCDKNTTKDTETKL